MVVVQGQRDCVYYTCIATEITQRSLKISPNSSMLAFLLVLLSGIHCPSVENTSPSTTNPLRQEAFPILSTYYQSSCRAIWFSLIHSIIAFYISYESLFEDSNEHNELYEGVRDVNFEDALWQVFVPGSVITRVDIEEGLVLEEILVEDWRPLKRDQGLFTYSKHTNSTPSRELYKFKQPHGVDISYLMQGVIKDTKTLHFLHLTPCEPTLNSEIIRLITQRFYILFTNDSIIGVYLTGSLDLEEIMQVKKAVNGLTFPGKFPTNDAMIKDHANMISLERQVKAGFIPTLGNYSFKATGLSLVSYKQLLRRIVAVAIQSVARMTFGGGKREKDILATSLQRYLRRIFPDCAIRKYSSRDYKKPMDLVFVQKKGITSISGLVLDCQECSSDSTNYSQEETGTNAQHQRMTHPFVLSYSNSVLIPLVPLQFVISFGSEKTPFPMSFD